MLQNLRIFVNIGSLTAVVNLRNNFHELTPVLFIFIVNFVLNVVKRICT